jgi:hypothetical protein
MRHASFGYPSEPPELIDNITAGIATAIGYCDDHPSGPISMAHHLPSSQTF